MVAALEEIPSSPDKTPDSDNGITTLSIVLNFDAPKSADDSIKLVSIFEITA